MAQEQDYFGNLVDVYRFPFGIYHKPIIDAIVKSIQALVHNHDKLKILDVGCGAGLKHPSLEGFGTVYGVDIAKKQIDFCRSHFGENYFLIQKGEKYPFGDDAFDIVIMSEVLEHVSPGDVPSFMSEVRRVLRGGGVMMVSTPNYESLLLTVLEGTILECIARARGFSRRGLHVNKYTEIKLREDIEKNGFTMSEFNRLSFGMVLFCVCGK